MSDTAVGTLDSDKLAGLAATLKQRVLEEDGGEDRDELVARAKGRAEANAEAAQWRESDALSKEERRRENRAAWLEHYLALSETYRRRAEFYAYKAERLCRDG